MRTLFTFAIALTMTFNSLAKDNTGETVRYHGVFYTVVYEGSDYSVLINSKTGERQIVNYSK
jgi:hypothetical protein